jgi:hypothetical protein
MVSRDIRSRTARYSFGLLLLLVIGYVSFVRGQPVPLLSNVDLGFHELGHMMTMVFPDRVAAISGSIAQIAVPIGLALYFFLASRDPFAGALMLGWAGTSARGVATYIADAPYERLELIGGRHDWAFLLGPEGFGVMRSAGLIAGLAWGFGATLLCAGVVISIRGLALPHIERREAAAMEARLETLPVHEPENLPREAP